MSTLTASTFGLDRWAGKLVLIAITIAAAIVALMVIRWVFLWIGTRPGSDADVTRARQRQTAVAVLSTALRYVVLVAAVVAIIVILAGGGGIGALGGSAVVAIIIGFAGQRLLGDMIAGFFILFEGQYAVGDLIRLEPSGYTGIVEEVGVRTTVLREANGDRCYIANGQITAVRRFPSTRAVLVVTLLTRDPDAAETALRALGSLTDAGTGTIIAPDSVGRRDVAGDLSTVHARVGVAAMAAETARDLVISVLRARLGEALVADPVVTPIEPREAERWPEPAIE